MKDKGSKKESCRRIIALQNIPRFGVICENIGCYRIFYQKGKNHIGDYLQGICPLTGDSLTAYY